MQEPHQFRIDLAKAQKAPFNQYLFRLMVALNDLMSIHYLFFCFERSNPPIQIQNGVESYLVRLMQSHTVEAYVAFIENVQPTKKTSGDPVLQYIQSNNDLNKHFACLNRNMENKYFIAIRQVRSVFTFHYDYKKSGKDTVKALARLGRVANSKRSNGGEDLIIIDRSSPQILDDDLPLQRRFVCADRLVSEGMAMFCGLDELADHTSNPDSIEFKRSTVDFAIEFMNFAEAMLLKWIGDNKLQKR